MYAVLVKLVVRVSFEYLGRGSGPCRQATLLNFLLGVSRSRAEATLMPGKLLRYYV